jgi:hypothetical protein
MHVARCAPRRRRLVSYRRIRCAVALSHSSVALLHRRNRFIVAPSHFCKVAPSHSLALLRLLHSLRLLVAFESQRVSELENCAFPHILLEETLEGNLKDIFDQIHVSEYPLSTP